VLQITTISSGPPGPAGPAAWAARLLGGLMILLLALLALVIIVPVAVVVVVLVGSFLVLRAIARWLRTAQSPNGVLDGRRNVRVIDPTDSPPAPPTDLT